MAYRLMQDKPFAYMSPFPTREKNPNKTLTRFELCSCVCFMQLLSSPKSFSNRGNFIAVVGQCCQRWLCSAIWWPQVEEIDTKLVNGPGSWKNLPVRNKGLLSCLWSDKWDIPLPKIPGEVVFYRLFQTSWNSFVKCKRAPNPKSYYYICKVRQSRRHIKRTLPWDSVLLSREKGQWTSHWALMTACAPLWSGPWSNL